jgi:prophage maintenance system killer protein
MANDLRRQLEIARFERALEVAESMGNHRVLLTTMELARLNNILTGKEDDDPWRQGPVTITLPTGRTETMALIADPKVTARDQLHRATELAEQGNIIDAAVDIYSQMVLGHVFKDANRRSAVCATLYFLVRYGIPISGLALHEIGLGDLRDERQIQALRDTITQLAKFAQGRKKE